MATIKTEDQSIPVDDSLVDTDEKVRRLLAPYYPDCANAEIRRETDPVNGLTITVVKRAGPKGYGSNAGGQVAQALFAAPRSLNPIQIVYEELQDDSLTVEQVALMAPRIEQAIDDGIGELRKAASILERLKVAAPQPANTVPIGF